MARKPRLEFEGALYHVIVRGNHRRDIFRDEATESSTSNASSNTRERYRCIVYAYVLMSNHVHLLIETGAMVFPRSCKGSSSAMRSADNPAMCWRGCLIRLCRSQQSFRQALGA